VQPAVSAKPVVRGYDSRDLFWEDALLRIDELKRQIDADLKKEDVRHFPSCRRTRRTYSVEHSDDSG
jgi:hypothetical protein